MKKLLVKWFDLTGLAIPLGLAAFLMVNFFYAYFSEDKQVLIDINSVGEANIEAILLPVVIIWGLVALIRVAKRWIFYGR